MLVPAIRKSVPSNLQRIAVYVAHRSKTRARILRYYCGSDLLNTSLPNFTACRIYSSEPDPQPRITLPMLMDGTTNCGPSFLTPLKLFYLVAYVINPHIDKEFRVAEVLQGALHAITVISGALANNDFESLDGLVASDAIEILKAKVETLSPNQRQLIVLDKEDMLYYVISDIAATKGINEHSVELAITCYYIPGLAKEKPKMNFTNFLENSNLVHLMCNYKFSRKYVDNVGGSWIATFVNHFTTL